MTGTIHMLRSVELVMGLPALPVRERRQFAPLVEAAVDPVDVCGRRHDLRQAAAQSRKDADDEREDGHPLAHELPDDLVILCADTN